MLVISVNREGAHLETVSLIEYHQFTKVIRGCVLDECLDSPLFFLLSSQTEKQT